MKFFSKIGIALLVAIALSTIPASAWEMTFEGHPNDLIPSQTIQTSREGAGIYSQDHGYAYYISTVYVDHPTNVIIDAPFDGYLAFQSKNKEWGGASAGTILMDVKLYNSTGSLVFSDSSFGGLSTPGSGSTIHTVEFVGTSSGIGIDCYVDGVFSDSSPFLVENPGNIEQISINFYSTYGGGDVFLDNFFTENSVIGCDNSLEYDTDDYQYYSTNFPHPIDAFMFVKVFDPEGTQIYSQNVSKGIEYSIPKSAITTGGTYSIKLYMHDNLSNTNYYFSSRNFICEIPTGYSLTLDKEIYSPGDTIQIFSYMPEYTSGHKVTINYKTTSGYTSYTYDVTQAEQTKNFLLPESAVGGSFFAYFRNPSDIVMATDSYEIIAPYGATNLYLDKSTYENNDTVKISYKYLPEDSDITLILRSGTTNTYTESWRALSGSGVKTFNIAGRAGDTIYVKAVTPVDGGTNTILKEATAKILSGEGYISGKIYDSSTNTPVSGATITIGGSSTTSNSLGEYEMSVLMGTQPVTITKDGYNQYTGQVSVHSLSSTKNFYLVKSISTGSDTLYGTITDYYTGTPLTSTYIQIKNGSTVLSALSHSKTGNYLFDQDSLAGEWEVTVTKTGYDTHTRIVTISGDTYLGIRLVPVGGSPVPGDEDQTDPSTPGGTTPTDRPGREAAKESMAMFETLVPGLIGIALLRVLMELLT